MAISKYASSVVAASIIAALCSPGAAFASATYNCTGASNCSGNGGNGDNGTNNGNNSSNNVINVNLPNGGYSSSLAARQAYGSSGLVGLPSFAPLGCGSRSSAYAGLTGAPAGGYGANMAFGVGFITAVGREPDICRPQAYVTQTSQMQQQPARQTADAFVTGRELQAATAFAPRDAPSENTGSPSTAVSQLAASRQSPSVTMPQASFVAYDRAGQPQYLTFAQPAMQQPAAAYAAPATGFQSPASMQTSGPTAPQLTAIPAWTALRGNTAPAGGAASPRAMCTHLDDDVAHFYAQDLRNARSVADSSRIVRDITTLDQACYHAYVRQAFGK